MDTNKRIEEMTEEEINAALKAQGHNHPVNAMYKGEDGFTYFDVTPQFLAQMIAKGMKETQ